MHAYEVPLGGGLPTRIPLPWTGPLSFNASGTMVAYNKLSRVFRPFHRKHYYAGQAQDIWTYNFKTGASQQITHWKGADAWPMWDGQTLYFTSDRGPHGVQNLWSYSFPTHAFTQLTHFKTYDIDWPSLGNDGVAFSDGGKLYVYALPKYPGATGWYPPVAALGQHLEDDSQRGYCAQWQACRVFRPWCVVHRTGKIWRYH